MKEKIIKVLINGIIGMVTSIATIYFGASAAEAVGASGAATSVIGGRASDIAMSFFSQVA